MNIHFIAIGGAAMHNLALALHNKGYLITGSDDTIFEPSKSRLQKFGLLPESFGWFPEKIHDKLDAVILGMHAKADNPELIQAQKLGITIYSYPEFLYQQSKDKTRVVIGGSHGKTTITSMVLHVMQMCNKKVDYMVGALLEGFETMVHLTNENDFMVLEGDEYLTSPIDLRPKFHLYQPNIALISGIAWDHINVFPSLENYIQQFEIFVEKITPGGILIYNEEDELVKQVAENATNPIRKIPYKTPEFKIENNKTWIETTEGWMPLQIFGAHNLNNLAGAKWICQCMGIDELDFYEAIASFKGASKRLEKIKENQNSVIFKDFAHSPSKVKATTEAVKQQYPNKTLLACLELHTYSSLNPDFLKEYQHALDTADIAVVFYSPEALQIKRMQAISSKEIQDAFQKPNLIVHTDPKVFQEFLKNRKFEETALLLMSSGNYGGLDFEEVKNWI